MTDRSGPYPQLLQILFLKHLGDQAHPAVNIKRLIGPCGGYDPGTLLPSMLQRKEPVIGQQSSIWMTIDGKNTAFVSWLIGSIHVSLKTHGALN